MSVLLFVLSVLGIMALSIVIGVLIALGIHNKCEGYGLAAVLVAGLALVLYLVTCSSYSDVVKASNNVIAIEKKVEKIESLKSEIEKLGGSYEDFIRDREITKTQD